MAKYTLYKGFKIIGQYDSIKEAKKNAPKSDGVYNLIGKDYKDSWQIINGTLYSDNINGIKQIKGFWETLIKVKFGNGYYSVDQAFDKTLVAKKNVVVFSAPPELGGKPKFNIASGKTIGIIYSYVFESSTGTLYWWIDDSQNKFVGFVKHNPNDFDISSLSAQGMLTMEEIKKREEEAKKSLPEKIADDVIGIFKNGLYIFGGIYLLKSLIS